MHFHISIFSPPPSFLLPLPISLPSPPLSLSQLKSSRDQVKWKIIETAGVSSRFQYSVTYNPVATPTLPFPGTQTFQSILVSPSHPQATPPLIVWPHGGPHSGYIAGFILWSECLAVLGFIIQCTIR